MASPSPQVFLHDGKKLMQRGAPTNAAATATALEMTRFKAMFGTFPVVCASIWQRLEETTERIVPGAKPHHLLWALMLLKIYANETVLGCAIAGSDEKTFRKWAWHFADGMSDLEGSVILWENRFLGDIGMPAKTSFDGVDFRSDEIRPFWNGNYGHKFNGPGIKYDIGLNIQTGDIVWLNGPYRCGIPDSECFKQGGVMNYYEDGEMSEGDGHYQRNIPERFITWPNHTEGNRMSYIVQARHETVNKRMRHFNVLSHDAFRHDPKKHSIIFRAVAVVTQLNMENGEPLFQVDYNQG